MGKVKTWIGEFVNSWDVSRSTWLTYSLSALRSFFVQPFIKRPPMEKTSVDYDLARSLYRNDNPEYNLGAGFIKPMIDLEVEYIGLPSVTSDDAETDDFLTECIANHWGAKLQEAFRDAFRDSKVFVRYRQPRLDNPLFTEEDRRFGKLDVLLPEEVELIFDPSDSDLVERAVVQHFIEIDERSDDEIVRGTAPRSVTHEVLEIIDNQSFRFFDKTAGEELTTWRTANKWGYVPIWPLYNEYMAELGGGISDIEPVLPFIDAFHEVLRDTLAAHKYHSIPKVKFNVKSVEQFIANNWPDVIDPNTGKIKDGAKINWQGREIMFFQPDEDAGFIEAKSVLGDSRELLGFLIDCIAVSSETPRWAYLSEVRAVPDQDASLQPFEKKIGRKRIMLQEPLVMLCKMALKANGKTPRSVEITWPTIRLADLALKGQAIQQIVLALDVATTHEWIADDTVIKILGSLFPEVSSPEIEKSAAKKNVVPELPAPAPQSDTQAMASKNGSGSKDSGKKAVATTKASRS
jgi:hypothetical protein